MRNRRLALGLLLTAAIALLGMLCQRLVNPAAFLSLLPYSFTRSTMSQATRKPVIVVGSGLAGLSAAHEALRAGAPVRMLDRAAKPGGNSIKASSGINGAGTRFQRAAGIAADELFYDDSVKSAGARFRHWKDGPAGDGDVQREKLIRTMVEQSGEAVTWLVDEIGVDLSVVAPLGGHSVARTHRGSGKTPPGAAVVTTLLKKLQADPNFELATATDVTGLAIADGVVQGVEYVRDGQPGRLLGTVVFTTGGFAGDATGLLARYRPDLGGMPSTNEARPASHNLLTPAGAEFVDMDSVQIHPTGFVDPQAPMAMLKFLAAEVLRGEGGILLSAKGERFVNEMETREHVSNAIMRQPRSDDDDGGDGAGPKLRQWDVTLLLDPGACEAAASHIGFYLFKGLIVRKKVRDLPPAVVAAVDRYAAAVAAGKDDDFGRMSFGRWNLPPGESNREEEVCVGRVTPIVHFTMGGVAFDERARVLRRRRTVPEDANGGGAGGEGLEPIPGLFAAGEVTGGVHGDNRLGGSSLLECVVFGRIAGAEAAKA